LTLITNLYRAEVRPTRSMRIGRLPLVRALGPDLSLLNIYVEEMFPLFSGRPWPIRWNIISHLKPVSLKPGNRGFYWRSTVKQIFRIMFGKCLIPSGSTGCDLFMGRFV